MMPFRFGGIWQPSIPNVVSCAGIAWLCALMTPSFALWPPLIRMHAPHAGDAMRIARMMPFGVISRRRSFWKIHALYVPPAPQRARSGP